MRLDEVQQKEQTAAYIPDVSFVSKALRSIKDELIGSANPRDLLNQAFEPFNIYFIRGKGESSLPQHNKIGVIRAVTDGEGSIEVEMEADLTDVFITGELWNEFAETIGEVIGHELIHRDQFTDIKNGEDTFEKPMADPNPKKQYSNYLANKHEMISYAYQTVSELRNDGHSMESIRHLIDNPVDCQSPPASASGMLTRYLDHFEIDSTEFRKYQFLMRNYAEAFEDE